MKINLIICISNILTDLCAIKQKIKIKIKCFSIQNVLIENKENF